MRETTRQLLKLKVVAMAKVEVAVMGRVKVVAKVASMMLWVSQKVKARIPMCKEIVLGKNGIRIKTDRLWLTKRGNSKQ